MTVSGLMQLLVRVAVPAMLMSALLLMHGLSMGHSAIPPASATGAHPVITGLSTHHGMSAEEGAVSLTAATALPPDQPVGADHAGSSHLSLAETCLAVLGSLVMAALLVLRLRGYAVSRVVRRGRTWKPLTAWKVQPPVRPPIYRLCVLRT